jgi:toxin ParE1/3/4
VAKRSRYEVRISRAARRDMTAAMRWSVREFGEDAAWRYEDLLAQAITDLSQDPERPGSQQRHDLAKGVFVYHPRFSRERARSALGVVNRPQHIVIYRRRDRGIEILRVLHDARELQRHLPEDHVAGPGS